MHLALNDVLGTDGNRRLLRHENTAFQVLFGAPLVFVTPNCAERWDPLFLVACGEETVNLYADEPEMESLRAMEKRFAQDPVAYVLYFNKKMELFFKHILGIRAECFGEPATGGWIRQRFMHDSYAASSSAPGILPPVIALRGAIEQQTRTGLHPHILIFILCGYTRARLAKMFREKGGGEWRPRLEKYNEALLEVATSIEQSSIVGAARRAGVNGVDPLPHTERMLKRDNLDGELEENGKDRRPLLETKEWEQDRNVKAAEEEGKSAVAVPLTGCDLSRNEKWRRRGPIPVDEPPAEPDAPEGAALVKEEPESQADPSSGSDEERAPTGTEDG